MSNTETHIARVQQLMREIGNNLDRRALVHDRSKLESPEKEMFDLATDRLKGLTYGSPEYKESLKLLGPALKRHYEHNTHHPEHVPLWKCEHCGGVFKDSQLPDNNFPELAGDELHDTHFCPTCAGPYSIYELKLERHVSVDGMSLMDLVEMLADWKAAGERHADGSMEKSLEINRGRFSISPQLQSILENTAVELGWIHEKDQNQLQ